MLIKTNVRGDPHRSIRGEGDSLRLAPALPMNIHLPIYITWKVACKLQWRILDFDSGILGTPFLNVELW